MDKNAIKKYAVWARRELIERVSQRAMFYGVTSEKTGDPDAAEVNGRLLSPVEKKQLQALIRKVREKGFDQIMEEVAYTWFNRFAALRFMEVNGYLPSLVRVFTNEAGEFKPQILSEALHLDLDGLDKQKVLELESGNKSEELFRYLLIVQCNALNSILPGMFQKIEDYTELLLPDNLLRDGSVIEQLVSCIPEEDWTDQVQIIGWLYQYYNTEPKDKVFADLKKNIKISKENIPAATQLFTPDWIVHYMVENSLGRLWLEGHPNDALKSEWKYYLDEAEQEPDVQAQLDEIWKEYAALKPEEIKVIDPCCGSGHILVVIFDVLIQIYEDYGYTAREAAVKIVENNLWGLDIDERAAQLSYFAVMMKARQYDRRFFTREVQPHVYAIEESNGISNDVLEYFAGSDISAYYSGRDVPPLLSDIISITNDLRDAKEYGSIIKVRNVDFDAIYARFEEIRSATAPDIFTYRGIDELLPLVNVARVLAQKYHIAVTNPPYMGNKGMDAKLSDYVQEEYFDEKIDLFAVFIRRVYEITRQNGFLSMITQHSWMFLQSFQSLRMRIIENSQFVNMAHLGARAFDEIGGEVVQTTAFVLRKEHIPNYKGCFVRLVGINGEKEKEAAYLNRQTIFKLENEAFCKVPNSPVSYWLGEKILSMFSYEPSLGELYDTKLGMSTNDNNRFLRFWHEVPIERTCFDRKNDDDRSFVQKWFPYSKGGSYRKWYGNVEYVINWADDGAEVKELASSLYGSYSRTCKNTQHFFREALTWGLITPGAYSCRYLPAGCVLGDAGPVCFAGMDDKILLAYLNSSIVARILPAINPTINCSTGVISTVPVFRPQEISGVRAEIEELSIRNIQLSKDDWDSFENSWNFERHPLLPKLPLWSETTFIDDKGKLGTLSITAIRLADVFEHWQKECDDRFDKVKNNEEELNRIFIDIYGLQDELNPEVEEKDITVRKADLSRDIRSFISYAVGCMFGRYSLAVKGLSYAGGVWDNSKYGGYLPDVDGIIPICDDEYFEDDIVGRFVKFVETVYGKDTLEENLRFIADALGGKGSSREVIRNYFINDFYADHLKVYQKRPIYWLFDSGKKNGFKCLIYMHRYQPDTIARIRTDYVHEQQSRYRTAIADLEQRVAGASPSERVKLTKQLSKIRGQAEELRVYEEKIHHLADQMIPIDLDDGVKVNYAKFQEVLAKIK